MYGNRDFITQKLKRRKALRVPLLKIKKRWCKSTLYAVTNLELTSNRILSLLSVNCCTSFASAVTPRMLSKQRAAHTIHVSKRHQNSVYGGLRFLQVYGDVNHTAGKRYFIGSLPVSILLQSVGPSTLRTFSPHSISTQHRSTRH